MSSHNVIMKWPLIKFLLLFYLFLIKIQFLYWTMLDIRNFVSKIIFWKLPLGSWNLLGMWPTTIRLTFAATCTYVCVAPDHAIFGPRYCTRPCLMFPLLWMVEMFNLWPWEKYIFLCVCRWGLVWAGVYYIFFFFEKND